MSSPDLESRPGETSPLLGSNRSARSEHEDTPEETTDQRPTASQGKEWLSFWFFAALGTGIITAAFLLTEWIMAKYGWEWFRYSEWTMEQFQQIIFWSILVSVVFSIANLIRLRTTRKPLQVAFNALVLGGLAFSFIYSLAQVVERLSWSRTIHCKEEYENPNPYPGYPGDRPRDPNRNPPGSQEDCLKWVPKMQIIILLLVLFVGLHAMLLVRLLIAMLEEFFSITSRYFRGQNDNVLSGPGQISFQVSLAWGRPQQNAIENQRTQEQTVTE